MKTTTMIAKTAMMGVVVMTALSSVALASTSDAKLYRKTDGKIEAITLNNLGAPVSNESEARKVAPTILDFRADKYLQACYVGSAEAGLKLVEALVAAADEGSIAQAKTEKIWANKQGRIRATVMIDDGQSQKVDEFKFVPCEQF
jgi:hypothetical protein